MEKPRGCAECLKTDKELDQLMFANLLGQKFILFLCEDCTKPFGDSLKAMSVGKQVSYLTQLGQIIGR